MSSAIRLALLAFLLVACDAAAPPAETGAPTPPAKVGVESFEAVPFAARFTPDGAYRLDPSLPLPYRRAPALFADKADQYDNRRAAAPQNFAITAPPERITTVRPMTEYEPMQALLFAYPSWAGQYANTTATFVNIAKVASDHGEVWVVVDSGSAETILKQRLTAAGVATTKFGREIKFWRNNFDSYWFIDFGPLPIIDRLTNTYAFGDFRYYHERVADDAIPTVLGRNLTRFGAERATTTFRMPLSTEGGTFQSTHDGVCITGSRQIYNMSCYTGTCRESILSLSLEALQTHQHTLEMKSVLARYAGCRELLVTHSITDDGTGHIDMYLKILDDDRVLVGAYEPPYALAVQRENAVLMNENAAFLESWVDGEAPRFQVVRMAMPGHQRVEDFWGQYDVPFTYINSTFFNGVNLWPVYGAAGWSAKQAEAQAVWEQILPDMEHIAIDAEELAFQSGAIHCVTRTVPKLEPGTWVADGACSEGVCGGVDGGYDGACQIGVNGGLCFGPDWLCGCNDCRSCPPTSGTACGGVSWRGCCEGGDVLYCENNQLKSLPCGGTGCGWSTTDGFYNCGLSGEDPSGQTPAACGCTPQCDGKGCGDDGCGGSCGTCAGAGVCVEGQCRDDCVDCTLGQVGCDGEVSWLCVAGPPGCNLKDAVDCAASGLVCIDGQCDSRVEPEPEPDSEPVAEPDVVEPGPDVVAEGEVEVEVDGAESRAEVVEPGPRTGVADDGCGGGGAPWTWSLLGGLGAAWAMGRRSRVRLGVTRREL